MTSQNLEDKYIDENEKLPIENTNENVLEDRIASGKNNDLISQQNSGDENGSAKSNMDSKQEKTNKCKICNKEFSLEDHDERSKSYLCNSCDKNIKLNTCDICDKKYTRPDHLRRHKEMHEKVKILKCPICDKQFREHNHNYFQKHLH